VSIQLDLFAPAEPAGPLDRLAAYWHEANQRWFGGEMKPVPIVAGLEKTRLTMGRAGYDWRAGYQIEIRESLLGRIDEPGMYREITDVLLHEMIHQYQHQTRGRLDEPHHGPEFTAWCNKIGAGLGLPEVAARKPRGREVPLSRYWPSCVRPDRVHVLEVKPDPLAAHVAEMVRVAFPAGRPVDEWFLAEYLQVSQVTVHRKLCALERHGLLIRTAGKFYLNRKG
jgi:predicted SprT family Zn-dependent metalloprotease